MQQDVITQLLLIVFGGGGFITAAVTIALNAVAQRAKDKRDAKQQEALREQAKEDAQAIAAQVVTQAGLDSIGLLQEQSSLNIARERMWIEQRAADRNHVRRLERKFKSEMGELREDFKKVSEENSRKEVVIVKQSEELTEQKELIARLSAQNAWMREKLIALGIDVDAEMPPAAPELTSAI